MNTKTIGRWINCIVLSALLMPGCTWADEWTTGDTYREATFLAIDAIDWAQTRNIARDPQHYHEQSPIFGMHPNTGEVNRYFALNALANIGVAYILPRGWREGFQYVSIGIEAGWVIHNYRLGISAKW
jgi:hypothetical protein